MTQIHNDADVAGTLASGTEIISRTKSQGSLTIFTPTPDRPYLGGFTSPKGVDYLRVNCSSPLTDANGELESNYGQAIVFGELARKLASMLRTVNHITVRGHYELQIQRSVPAYGKNAGREFFNKVFIVYGFAVGDTFWSTENGKLVESEYNGARKADEPVRKNWFTAEAAPTIDVNTPPTKEEEEFAASALAHVTGKRVASKGKSAK